MNKNIRILWLVLSFVFLESAYSQYHNCSLFEKKTWKWAFIPYTPDNSLSSTWIEAIDRAATKWNELNGYGYGYYLYKPPQGNGFLITKADLGSPDNTNGAQTDISNVEGACTIGDEVAIFRSITTTQCYAQTPLSYFPHHTGDIWEYWASTGDSVQNRIISDTLGPDGKYYLQTTMFGKAIVDEFQSAGKHHITIRSNNLTSGIYFYRLVTTNYIATKKMVLLR